MKQQKPYVPQFIKDLGQEEVDFISATWMYRSKISCTLAGDFLWYEDEPSERRRYLCIGAKGFLRGDVLSGLDNDQYRRIKFYNKHKATRVKILYRYYTVNQGYRNYHARVLLLDGPGKGKIRSFEM